VILSGIQVRVAHGFTADVGALEARLADVEGGYGDTLYKLHRASVKADLRTARILERWEIEDVSDEAIDRPGLRRPCPARMSTP
jgi:hypothetical protein